MTNNMQRYHKYSFRIKIICVSMVIIVAVFILSYMTGKQTLQNGDSGSSKLQGLKDERNGISMSLRKTKENHSGSDGAQDRETKLGYIELNNEKYLGKRGLSRYEGLMPLDNLKNSSQRPSDGQTKSGQPQGDQLFNICLDKLNNPGLDYEQKLKMEIALISSGAFSKTELLGMINNEEINGEIRRSIIQLLEKQDFFDKWESLIMDNDPIVREATFERILDLDLDGEEAAIVVKRASQMILGENDAYVFEAGIKLISDFSPEDVYSFVADVIRRKDIRPEIMLTLIEYLRFSQLDSKLLNSVLSHPIVYEFRKDKDFSIQLEAILQ